MYSSLSLRAACCAVFLLLGASVHASGDSRTADDFRAEGVSLYERGRYAEAIFSYGKALMLNPRHQAALHESGLTNIKLGQTDAAQVQLERLKKVCSGCSEATGLARAIAQAAAAAQ